MSSSPQSRTDNRERKRVVATLVGLYLLLLSLPAPWRVVEPDDSTLKMLRMVGQSRIDYLGTESSVHFGPIGAPVWLGVALGALGLALRLARGLGLVYLSRRVIALPLLICFAICVASFAVALREVDASPGVGGALALAGLAIGGIGVFGVGDEDWY